MIGRREVGSVGAGLAAVASAGASILPVALLGALIVQLREDIAISTFQLGAIIALFYLVSTIGSIPAGGLVDRLGWPRGVWLATLHLTLPLLVLATLARTAWHVAAIFVVAGLGNAVAQPAANLAIIRGVSIERQGIAFGIKQASIPAGSLAAGAAVPLIALRSSWQWAVVVPVLIFLALAAGTPFRGFEHRERPAREPVGALLREPALLSLTAANFGSAMAVNPLFAFFVESSVARGIGPGTAGTLLAAGSGMGLVSRLLVGWASDRYPVAPERMIRQATVYALLGAPGFVILGTLGDRVGFVYLALLFALGFGFAWGGLFNLAVTRIWSDRPAAATGVAQAGLWTGGTLGPLLFGIIATRSYTIAWLMSAGFLLVAALALMNARRLLLTERVTAP